MVLMDCAYVNGHFMVMLFEEAFSEEGFMENKDGLPSEKSKDTLLCPIRYTLEVLGGKWKLPIICLLSSGKPTRYSVIKRKLTDVTGMMLSQSLKELEAADIIHREQYNEVPPRVEYTLTKKGETFVPVLDHVAGWAVENMADEESCGSFCEECRKTS